MKKILVPVDFSQCSLDAFLYAKELAHTLGFSLKVIHIYSGNLNTNESLTLQNEKTRQEITNEQLENFVSTIPENGEKQNVLTKVKIETEAFVALNVTSKIVKLTSDEEVAMVVIGATGEGNIVDRILGSVSSSIAQRAHCPVFLIPQGLTYSDFKNVLYASNYESADEDLIQQIIDFGNVFRATMHFVHVDEQDNYDNVEDTIFYKLFEKGDPAFSFNIVNIKNRTIMSGLNQYADENEVDLIVLVNRQRSYLENFFHLSLTKKMAETTKLPLLVFHLMNE